MTYFNSWIHIYIRDLILIRLSLLIPRWNVIHVRIRDIYLTMNSFETDYINISVWICILKPSFHLVIMFYILILIISNTFLIIQLSLAIQLLDYYICCTWEFLCWLGQPLAPHVKQEWWVNLLDQNIRCSISYLDQSSKVSNFSFKNYKWYISHKLMILDHLTLIFGYCWSYQ